ncbi:Receptor-like protein 12 [Hordeum vulgare]|nr:Receptor-like protein 12 [Hordeum vulgare]
MDEHLGTPINKLQKCITAAQEGVFFLEREKDELTEALGNADHPGRTRGTPGSIPWKVGFPDAAGYRCRARKRKAELSDRQKINARLQILEELESERAADQPSKQHETTPEFTPPSQWRSNVVSTELVQPDFMATSYPVDTITESQPCELLMKCRNLTFKAASGVVTPPQSNGTFHVLLIPRGFAVVMVDEVKEGFEQLELDHPTGEDENKLVHALRSTCLWPKEYIKLPNWMPPPPPASDQGTPRPPPVTDHGTPHPPPIRLMIRALRLLRRVRALRLLIWFLLRRVRALRLLLRLLLRHVGAVRLFLWLLLRHVWALRLLLRLLLRRVGAVRLLLRLLLRRVGALHLLLRLLLQCVGAVLLLRLLLQCVGAVLLLRLLLRRVIAVLLLRLLLRRVGAVLLLRLLLRRVGAVRLLCNGGRQTSSPLHRKLHK